jgi:signal transduction histidine kinase/CheY-like chemotaxis protein
VESASDPVGRHGTAPEPFGAGVDPRVLVARQIRLYIENAPVFYPVSISVGFVVVAALLWPFTPDNRVRLALWGGLIVATLLARVLGWMAYAAARPGDDAVGPWLKWFLVPQILSVTVIGSGPFFFLPSGSGRDFDILLVLSTAVFLSTFGSSLKLSAYRPAIPLVLTPLVVIYAAGVLQLPGSVPKVLALASVFCGVFGWLLASRVNQAFVRSMELSIRNEQLVVAAEQARQAAERAEREKTRFLAAASHDLRQPMHAISLLVGMLQPRAAEADRAVMRRLEHSVEAMDSLFATILDLSKLDSGAVQPSAAEVPLAAILDSIELHFGPEAAAKGLALRVFRSRAVVRTDRALLERVVRNLVSNAIKYTPSGTVLVGCRRRGERLRVGVWDTGVGIARADLDRIFDEFFQAGPAIRDRGQGLGLSIAQRLARLLESRIEVASTPGRGSWFALAVPFVAWQSTPSRRHDAAPGAEFLLAGKFVLVVDDDPQVRFGTEALLRQWGCHAASAATLEEVQATLERELRFPDAVVTDYRLGEGRTGLEVIAAVRSYTGEHTAAVIVTGEDGIDTASLGHPAIRKPVSANELRKCLVSVAS